MDESNPTCNKRFARAGIAQTEEARRAHRALIVTTAGLSECSSGAILYDETIRQRTRDGTPFARALAAAGIIPGIKVDTGAKDMAGHPGEKITEGLDGLRGRLAGYKQMGARFAKWCAVIAVGNALNLRFPAGPPWALAFSFSRAIQQPALRLTVGYYDVGGLLASDGRPAPSSPPG